jgi:hypothetical protein
MARLNLAGIVAVAVGSASGDFCLASGARKGFTRRPRVGYYFEIEITFKTLNQELLHDTGT